MVCFVSGQKVTTHIPSLAILSVVYPFQVSSHGTLWRTTLSIKQYKQPTGIKRQPSKVQLQLQRNFDCQDQNPASPYPKAWQLVYLLCSNIYPFTTPSFRFSFDFLCSYKIKIPHEKTNSIPSAKKTLPTQQRSIPYCKKTTPIQPISYCPIKTR
jgi:hypothetical protein